MYVFVCLWFDEFVIVWYVVCVCVLLHVGLIVGGLLGCVFGMHVVMLLELLVCVWCVFRL